MAKILGRATGFNRLDVAVLTLDLPDSCQSTQPKKTNLGSLAAEVTGVSMEHIKAWRKRPEYKKWHFIRDGDWTKEDMGLVKTVYAALDVTLPFPIIFRYLVHIGHAFSTVGRRRRDHPTWEKLLQEAFGELVDRELCPKKMRLRMDTTRDIMKKTSALALSDSVSGQKIKHKYC